MKTILIVDDDEWVSEHFTWLLSKAGYAVRTATNALIALDTIDDVRPDCIVLDVLLTGPNGFVLLHELRSHDDLKAIPVVLCTNSTESLSGEMTKSYGVVRVLDKATMVPADLVAAVRKALLV